MTQEAVEQALRTTCGRTKDKTLNKVNARRRARRRGKYFLQGINLENHA